MGFRSAYCYLSYAFSYALFSGQSLEKVVYTPPLQYFLYRFFSDRYDILKKEKCLLFFLTEIPETHLVSIFNARIFFYKNIGLIGHLSTCTVAVALYIHVHYNYTAN